MLLWQTLVCNTYALGSTSSTAEPRVQIKVQTPVIPLPGRWSRGSEAEGHSGLHKTVPKHVRHKESF